MATEITLSTLILQPSILNILWRQSQIQTKRINLTMHCHQPGDHALVLLQLITHHRGFFIQSFQTFIDYNVLC